MGILEAFKLSWPITLVWLAFFYGCAPIAKEDLSQVDEKEEHRTAPTKEDSQPEAPTAPEDPPKKASTRSYSTEILKGQDFRHPTLHFEMVWMPPGNFLIGSNDKNAPANEKSGSLVSITKGFWLARKETSQELYEAVMQENPSDFKGAQRPVENLAYFEASDFCEKLTRFEQSQGRLPSTFRYHLPTEAQWEFAAKGGAEAQKLEFPTIDKTAWHKGNSTAGPAQPGKKTPHPLGFYDIFGNVAELCFGRAAPLPSTSQKDWIGPQDGDFCVARGGSWFSPPVECNATKRMEVLPTSRMSTVGFRLALGSALAGR